MTSLIIIVLAVAFLAAAIYAALLRGRLSAAHAEVRNLRNDESRFRAIAASVLEESRRSLSADTSERLADILSPLRANIDAFNSVISEKYTREAQERYALTRKIDELAALNASLGKEARQLTDALRSNGKVQGDWGETILLRLMEQAGFVKGREFDVQPNFVTKPGTNVRPDFVLHLPDRGMMVIDSKASVTAYARLCAATDETERTEAAKAHVKSVRDHVRELAAKKYHELAPANCRLEFVVMFIPNDGACIAALQHDPDLWTDAWRQNVVIASPTQFFAMVKLVQQLWLHDAQNRNATEIAEQAARMYDKFAGFLSDMQAVKQRLDQAADAHAAAMNKLSEGRGNLMSRARDLHALGLKTEKIIK